MMNIKVRFFGQLIDVVGATDLEFRDVSDTDSLRKKMLSGFQQLEKYTFVLAVNKKIEQGNKVLKPGDVVVILPPFSGG